VVQWTCTGGSNQEWAVTRLSSGAYTLTNAHTGLRLTTSTRTADGGAVTQQSDTGSPLQRWTVN